MIKKFHFLFSLLALLYPISAVAEMTVGNFVETCVPLYLSDETLDDTKLGAVLTCAGTLDGALGLSRFACDILQQDGDGLSLTTKAVLGSVALDLSDANSQQLALEIADTYSEYPSTHGSPLGSIVFNLTSGPFRCEW